MNFEDFLKDMCFSINPTVLDDNMPDYFDNWLSTLEGEDYIRYADSFGQLQYVNGMENIVNSLKK